MKTHTSDFKNSIKNFGREIDVKVIYTLNGDEIELGADELNSFTPHYEGAILKSVMKQLDLDSNVDIPLNTVLNAQFGVKVGNSYEYIDFGNYVVYKSEKQEDTSSYKITCYDKLLYSMVDYENLNITYPITVRDYIDTICTHLGLTFANSNDTFANYNRQIQNELYLDSDNNSIGYTFRDVLDELAEVTASTICINDNDELEIRYITQTSDTIDEDFLKNVNVNFGEQFGPVNTIVLSRSVGADNIYYPSTLPENPYEIKISDNQIMNGNDRADYLPDIYAQLNGLQYYINDYSSPGIAYYDLCDRYTVSIGNTSYSCVMLNDELNVTQGLEENVHTDLPEETITDYTKADKTDRKINQAYIMVDKQNQEIEALAERVINVSKTKSGTGSITLENAYNGTLHSLSIKGQISLLFPQNENGLYGQVPYGNEILYPSGNLYPKGNILLVDDVKYPIDLDYLNYINNEACDEFIYEDGKCKIIRRVGINSQGEKYALDNEIVENRADIDIQVSTSSIISLESFSNVVLSTTYLTQNQYTDNFAPTVDLIAKINLNPGNALIEASKLAKISSEKINLEGYTTINNGFSIDLDGNMTCNNANINGDIITSKGVLTNLQYPCELWGWAWENVYDKQGGGAVGFNFNDELNAVHKSFLNFTVRIPDNFTIKSAKIHLRHTPVSWASPDAQNYKSGSCKNLRAYITSNLGAMAYAQYQSEYHIGGNTPNFNLISSVASHSFGDAIFETYTTEDFKDVFSTADTYNISIMTTDSIGTVPGINNAYNTMGSQTGILTGVLEIIGYTANV